MHPALPPASSAQALALAGSSAITDVQAIPITVEAAIVIHSSGQNAGQADVSRGTPCSVLERAFASAWVAP